jgi:hypothetical protein
MRTTRLSPITVGVFVVALLVVVAEVTVVRRSGRQTDITAAPVPSEPPSPSAPPAPQPPPAAAPSARPTPLVATGPALLEAEAEADAGVDAGADRAAVLQRRALLAAGQNQRLIQQVDETLFMTSKMGDPTRVAIRRINEDHARRLQALLEAGGPDGTAAALGEAERSRRAALDSLLGPEASRAFDMAEHMASRRVRPRYRRAWAEELRQQAPLPP